MTIGLPDLQSVNPLFRCLLVTGHASFCVLARCVYGDGFPILKRASSMSHRENEEWIKLLDKIRHIVRIVDAALVVLIGQQLNLLIE
jgi:hypothetical protein